MGSFSNSHIKYSMDFMDKVRNLPTHDKKLVSFDVDSLFTNVPLDDVLDFLERKLSSFHQRIPIPDNCFIDLIRLCVTNNVFLLTAISISKYMVSRWEVALARF